MYTVQWGDVPTSHAVHQIIEIIAYRQGIFKCFNVLLDKKETLWSRCDFKDIPVRTRWYHMNMLEPSLFTEKYIVLHVRKQHQFEFIPASRPNKYKMKIFKYNYN